MIMLAPPEVDMDAVDALADKFVAPDRPPMPPAWCASCWAVPAIVTSHDGHNVICACGQIGPTCTTTNAAKAAWNRAQWAKYTTDGNYRYLSEDSETERLEARRRAVARAYGAYKLRNPLTILARQWATHRVSKCCGVTYRIVRHHKQDDPVAICRKCGQSFAVAPILKAKQERANGK
jgi:hypothetical protein